MAELDLVTPGMMMAEITPRLGPRAMAAAPLRRSPSSLGTIFAIALARLGRPVSIIARGGNDRIGDWMIDALANAEVGMTRLALRHGPVPLLLPARHARSPPAAAAILADPSRGTGIDGKR